MAIFKKLKESLGKFKESVSSRIREVREERVWKESDALTEEQLDALMKEQLDAREFVETQKTLEDGTRQILEALDKAVDEVEGLTEGEPIEEETKELLDAITPVTEELQETGLVPAGDSAETIDIDVLMKDAEGIRKLIAENDGRVTSTIIENLGKLLRGTKDMFSNIAHNNTVRRVDEQNLLPEGRTPAPVEEGEALVGEVFPAERTQDSRSPSPSDVRIEPTTNEGDFTVAASEDIVADDRTADEIIKETPAETVVAEAGDEVDEEEFEETDEVADDRAADEPIEEMIDETVVEEVVDEVVEETADEEVLEESPEHIRTTLGQRLSAAYAQARTNAQTRAAERQAARTERAEQRETERRERSEQREADRRERTEQRENARAEREALRNDAIAARQERREAFDTEKSGIAYQALKNSRGIVQRAEARIRKKIEVEKGRTSNIGRRQVKRVYSPEGRETTADIGTVMNVAAGYWNEPIDFGGNRQINMPECRAKIFKNLQHIFVTTQDGKLTSTIKPEVAGNLSSTQIKLLNNNIQSVIDKIRLIHEYIQPSNRDGFSYSLVKSYLEELDYTTSKCQDIYSSIVSSDRHLNNVEQQIKTTSIEGNDFSGQKRDVTLAFRQMGWEIKLDATTPEEMAKQIDGISIGNITPFTRAQVVQFINNYNALPASDKRDFTIQGLFDVFVATAKSQVNTRMQNDTPQARAAALAEIDKQKDDFTVESPKWRLASLSQGSEHDYSLEMMRALTTYRDYGVSKVQAVETVLQYRDVVAWEKLVSSLQNESQVTAKIEEIKAPYIEAIANEVALSDDGKINTGSDIYKAYAEILGVDRTINNDLENAISRQVYDFLEKSNQLDSEIKSFEDWQKVQGLTTSTPIPAPVPNPTSTIDVSAIVNKDNIEKILGVEENKNIVTKWMEDTGFGAEGDTTLRDKYVQVVKDLVGEEFVDLFTDDFIAVAGLLNDAAIKPENAGKTLDEVWESVVNNLDNEAENEADPEEEITTEKAADEIFSADTDYRMSKDVLRFGMFHEIFDAFSKKIAVTNPADKNKDVQVLNNERAQQIDKFILAFRGEKINSAENEFYQEVKNCIIAGSCAGNKYHEELFNKAKDDALITRYYKYIEGLPKTQEEGDKFIVAGKMTKEQVEAAIQEGQTALATTDKSARLALANQAVQEKKIEPVNTEEDILKTYNEIKSSKVFTLGDKKTFDVEGFQKKLKPFNVKAGKKYLDELAKAIKKVVIMQQGENATGRDNDIPGGGNGKDKGGKDAPTPPTGEIDNETGNGTGNGSYTQDELKEKAVFFMMGQALNMSLNDTIQAGGLSEEDKNRLISEQKDMQNLFDLITFGEDKDKKFKYNNGSNVVECGKIGYIQQIIYNKSSNPNFVLNEDELARVLADGQDVAIGGAQGATETLAEYTQRVKAVPAISSIIKSLNALSPEVACALVGLTATRDKDGNAHFGEKINEKILEGLKNAKTPNEIKAALAEMSKVELVRDEKTGKLVRKSGPLADILEDAKLDIAVAKSREEFRNKTVEEIIERINPEDSKEVQRATVSQYTSSQYFADKLRDIGISNDADAIKKMKEAIENDVFAQIEKGISKSNNDEIKKDDKIVQPPVGEDQVLDEEQPEEVEEEQIDEPAKADETRGPIEIKEVEGFTLTAQELKYLNIAVNRCKNYQQVINFLDGSQSRLTNVFQDIYRNNPDFKAKIEKYLPEKTADNAHENVEPVTFTEAEVMQVRYTVDNFVSKYGNTKSPEELSQEIIEDLLRITKGKETEEKLRKFDQKELQGHIQGLIKELSEEMGLN